MKNPDQDLDQNLDQNSDQNLNNDPSCFIFNGDADGIISQHILTLEFGAPALRITGLKRDIELLKKLPENWKGEIRVCDISLKQNLNSLKTILEKGHIKVAWYDHHEPGELFDHENLEKHIHESSGLCSAAIVHNVLGQKYPLWAAMAAFGDNIPDLAPALVQKVNSEKLKSNPELSSHPSEITAAELGLLRKAGLLLNYNAYGESLSDLRFDPEALAKYISDFSSALDFAQDQSIFGPLENQFSEDQTYFAGLKPIRQSPWAQAFSIPSEPWARRYAATWANERILAKPWQALATLTPLTDGSYSVSIRARREKDKPGPSAADLASEFPTGGGRKLAAGINGLPKEDVDKFLQRFEDFFKP